MSGPPTDIQPSELFLKLTEKPAPSEIVDFPRYDENGKALYQIRLRVLTQRQIEKAQVVGRKVAREKLKQSGLPEADLNSEAFQVLEADARQKEILALACFDPREEKPFCDVRVFWDGTYLDQLGPLELGVLASSYYHTQARFGPVMSGAMTKDDVNEWIKRLELGAPHHFLSRLDSGDLAVTASLFLERALKLSLILDGLYEELPTSLSSELNKLGIGTGYFGELATDFDNESKDEDFLGIGEGVDLMTPEQTAAAAKKMRDDMSAD